MKNRPLLIAALTVISGTGPAAFLLLRLPGGPAAGRSAAQQSRAFAAAAAPVAPAPAPPPPAAAPGRNTAASTPRSTPIVRAPIDDLLAPMAAKIEFLTSADRTPEAQLRLDMLTQLRAALIQRHKRQDVHTPPIPAQPGDTPVPRAGTIRRLWTATTELDTALKDVSTLTPSAKAQWDQHEATAWQDAPRSSLGIHISAGGLWDFASNSNFQSHRDTLTEPLLKEYEQLDDQYAEMTAFPTNANNPPVFPQEFLDIGNRLQQARDALYAAMLETEKQRRHWGAKSWTGWEESVLAEAAAEAAAAAAAGTETEAGGQ